MRSNRCMSVGKTLSGRSVEERFQSLFVCRCEETYMQKRVVRVEWTDKHTLCERRVALKLVCDHIVVNWLTIFGGVVNLLSEQYVKNNVFAIGLHYYLHCDLCLRGNDLRLNTLTCVVCLWESVFFFCIRILLRSWGLIIICAREFSILRTSNVKNVNRTNSFVDIWITIIFCCTYRYLHIKASFEDVLHYVDCWQLRFIFLYSLCFMRDCSIMT